jgi:hypothetical protein
MGGILSGFDLPESGPKSIKGVWVVLAIEASALEAAEGQRLYVGLKDSADNLLNVAGGYPMPWRSLGAGYPMLRTITFQAPDDWELPAPGRYQIVARVDETPVEGAIDFHGLPPSGPLLGEEDEPTELSARVDWAHLCLKWPREDTRLPGYYWVEDITEYYPTLDDNQHTLTGAVVAVVSFPPREGPYHKMRVEFTDSDGQVLATFEEGSIVGERYGIRQPFRKLVSAPFAGLILPRPGDYTFQIFLDDAHLHSLEYPVVRVQELPPGWQR